MEDEVASEAETTPASATTDPTVASLHSMFETVRAAPKRVVFAEGEEERAIRSAIAFRSAGYGTPVLIGRESHIRETMAGAGLAPVEDLEIHNAKVSKNNKRYADFLL